MFAAVSAGILTCNAQTNFFSHPPSLPKPLSFNPSFTNLTISAMPVPGGQRGFWFLMNTNGLLAGTNSLYRVVPKPLAPAMPKPGIYQAEPYSGIVIVPGPHPDDRAIIGWSNPTPGAPAVTPEMPTVKPELRLVPREPKKAN